jgi:hypothetical protein
MYRIDFELVFDLKNKIPIKKPIHLIFSEWYYIVSNSQNITGESSDLYIYKTLT